MIIVMKPVEMPGATMELKRGTLIQMPGECPHGHLLGDPNGEIITCKDCEKQISAYWILMRSVTQWKDFAERMGRDREQLNEDMAKAVTHRAALKVEKAWRRRKRVPVCPHCRVPILPTDGFGEMLQSKLRIVEAQP